jgi:hypothetical protein
MEEWNIYRFHIENYSNKIPGETILGGRLWLFFLSIFGFAWTTLCYFVPNRLFSTTLMMLLIDFTILNGIQHVVLSIKIKKYNPGLIFGGIVALTTDIVLIGNIAHRNILPVWALVGLLFLVLPFLIETAISSKKNKMPKMLVWILNFSTKLEKAMVE